VHTGSNPAFNGFRALRSLANYAVRADGTQVPLALLASQPNQSLLALAGIAKPDLFFDMLRERGLRLDRTLPLPDHYDFDSWSSKTSGLHKVICTEKDAVKLWRHHPEALAVPLVVILEPQLLAELDRMIDSLGPMATPPRLLSSHGHTTT
jgi:tetraacyldisaccharide 4'-kinase